MLRVFHAAESRGYANHGWLDTHHSFSFASYYDKARMGFGALRVLNDDTIAPGAGFDRHAHENMEIITIPLSGSLKHEDGMGNSAVIETGEVQVMSAGTGVEHAEYNVSATDPLTLLQIWITTNEVDVEPRYDQKRFDETKYRNTFYQVVGPMDQVGVLGIHQDARISLGRFDTGKEISYTLSSLKHSVYFFVIDGEGTIGSQGVSPRDALGFWDMETVTALSEKVFFWLSLRCLCWCGNINAILRGQIVINSLW